MGWFELEPEFVMTPRGRAMQFFEVPVDQIADTHRATAYMTLGDMAAELGPEAVPPDGLHWFAARVRPGLGAPKFLLESELGVNGRHPAPPKEIAPGHRIVHIQTGFNDEWHRIWILERRGMSDRLIGETVAHEAFHHHRDVVGIEHTEVDAVAFAQGYRRRRWPPWIPPKAY